MGGFFISPGESVALVAPTLTEALVILEEQWKRNACSLLRGGHYQMLSSSLKTLMSLDPNIRYGAHTSATLARFCRLPAFREKESGFKSREERIFYLLTCLRVHPPSLYFNDFVEDLDEWLRTEPQANQFISLFLNERVIKTAHPSALTYQVKMAVLFFPDLYERLGHLAQNYPQIFCPLPDLQEVMKGVLKNPEAFSKLIIYFFERHFYLPEHLNLLEKALANAGFYEAFLRELLSSPGLPLAVMEIVLTEGLLYSTLSENYRTIFANYYKAYRLKGIECPFNLAPELVQQIGNFLSHSSLNFSLEDLPFLESLFYFSLSPHSPHLSFVKTYLTFIRTIVGACQEILFQKIRLSLPLLYPLFESIS